MIEPTIQVRNLQTYLTLMLMLLRLFSFNMLLRLGKPVNQFAHKGWAEQRIGPSEEANPPHRHGAPIVALELQDLWNLWVFSWCWWDDNYGSLQWQWKQWHHWRWGCWWCWWTLTRGWRRPGTTCKNPSWTSTLFPFSRITILFSFKPSPTC